MSPFRPRSHPQLKSFTSPLQGIRNNLLRILHQSARANAAGRRRAALLPAATAWRTAVNASRAWGQRNDGSPKAEAAGKHAWTVGTEEGRKRAVVKSGILQFNLHYVPCTILYSIYKYVRAGKDLEGGH